jgi:hypothetical protein
MLNILFTHARQHVVAYLALFIALSGTAYAASSLPRNSVGTNQLRDGAVVAPKLGRLPAVNAFTDDFEQQLSDGVFAAVRLENEAFDIGAMHSAGDNDSRVVAPRTGTYIVQGTAAFSGGTCGGSPRVVLIQRHLRDGNLVDVDRAVTDTVCSEPTRVHAGAVVRLKAGEFLELIALQRSSPNVGVSGRLSAAYVGS